MCNFPLLSFQILGQKSREETLKWLIPAPRAWSFHQGVSDGGKWLELLGTILLCLDWNWAQFRWSTRICAHALTVTLGFFPELAAWVLRGHACEETGHSKTARQKQHSGRLWPSCRSPKGASPVLCWGGCPDSRVGARTSPLPGSSVQKFATVFHNWAGCFTCIAGA